MLENHATKIPLNKITGKGKSVPEHKEFWILQSSSHRGTNLLVCFKKEKKYMKSNIHLATVLANLCWARLFPLLGCAHSVIHIPQALLLLQSHILA